MKMFLKYMLMMYVLYTCKFTSTWKVLCPAVSVRIASTLSVGDFTWVRRHLSEHLVKSVYIHTNHVMFSITLLLLQRLVQVHDSLPSNVCEMYME